MSQGRVGLRSRLLNSSLLLAGILFSASILDAGNAEARTRHRHHVRAKVSRSVAPYSPAYSAMVVDANTGRVLHAKNENELRHPASVTKVMTLYMLFEQLEKGKLQLDSEIPISAHAASMAPSKLGLRPGSTIEVEDAIKAVVTKSANDIAAAIAEAIGGSEDHFAEMMTAKAHSLGMTRTHYANASGLPDPEQITTARDLTILGRAIQDRFPRYYSYFSTHVFNFHGQSMRNHNHLLGRVEGMDGIKTGYTRASGFNLLTSVKRGNKRIVSVVLGGPSAGVRDRIMADLIEDNLDGASTIRTASAITESSPAAPAERVERPAPREVASAEMVAPKPIPVAAVPAPAPVPVVEKPRPAVIASMTRPSADDRTASIPERRIVLDGSTRPVTASAATTPGNGGLRWMSGPPAATAKAAPLPTPAPKQDVKIASIKPEMVRETVQPKAEATRPALARTGVMIQIGATDEAAKAQELLSRAKQGNPSLATAQPFTEKVQKGSGALWRARFALASESQAETACKSLKRSGFACFTTHN